MVLSGRRGGKQSTKALVRREGSTKGPGRLGLPTLRCPGRGRPRRRRSKRSHPHHTRSGTRPPPSYKVWDRPPPVVQRAPHNKIEATLSHLVRGPGRGRPRRRRSGRGLLHHTRSGARPPRHTTSGATPVVQRAYKSHSRATFEKQGGQWIWSEVNPQRPDDHLMPFDADALCSDRARAAFRA